MTTESLVRAANVAIVIGCFLQGVTLWVLFPQFWLWGTAAKDKLAIIREATKKSKKKAREIRMDYYKQFFGESDTSSTPSEGVG